MLPAMLGDRKKMASDIVLMIGKKKDNEGNSSEYVSKNKPEEENNESDYMSLAEEMISAIKEGSADRLASCLSGFSNLCKMPEMDKEE